MPSYFMGIYSLELPPSLPVLNIPLNTFIPIPSNSTYSAHLLYLSIKVVCFSPALILPHKLIIKLSLLLFIACSHHFRVSYFTNLSNLQPILLLHPYQNSQTSSLFFVPDLDCDISHFISTAWDNDCTVTFHVLVFDSYYSIEMRMLFLYLP